MVEESRDIVAIEKTGEFRGRYHVLLGAMSPLEGIGPGAAEDQGAVRPHRAGGHRGGHPVHQPEHRGRGHGDVPRPDAEAVRRDGSPASPAACRSAATSSTPTSSRSAVPSKVVAPSTDRLDRPSRVTRALGGETDWGTTPWNGCGRTGRFVSMMPQKGVRRRWLTRRVCCDHITDKRSVCQLFVIYVARGVSLPT